MATIIDAMVVTLGLNAKGYAQEAQAVWQSFARAAYESDRALRFMEARAKEAAAFLGKIRGDALALLDVVAAGFGLQGFAGNIAANAAGQGEMGQADVESLSASGGAAGLLAGALRSGGIAGDREEGDAFLSVASRLLVDSRLKDGVRSAEAVPHLGIDGGPSELHTADKAAQPEGGWQSALLALGSLKILSTTDSLPGLASALEASAESIDGLGGDGEVAAVATPLKVGRVAADIALLARRQDETSVESSGRSRADASGPVSRSRDQAIFDAAPDGEGNVDGAGAWSPPRLAEFKRAFGVDLHHSTHEQQLAFVDWESNRRGLTAKEQPADAKTPMLITEAMDRYLGIEQFEGADGVAPQDAAAGAAIYVEGPRDDLERGGTAAASMAMAAQGGAVAALSGSAPVSNTSETHIHGAITLVTQAMDSQGFARELAGLGRSQSLIQQGNTGIF